MKIDNLKWIKNVNDKSGKKWAYANWKRGDVFSLNWKADQIKNAAKVQCSELILLLQEGMVTHLVEVTDNQPCKVDDTEWGVVRQVKVLWIADFNHENHIPQQRDLFGYTSQYQNGTLKSLENLKDIPPRWHSLDAFRRHVAELLPITD